MKKILAAFRDVIILMGNSIPIEIFFDVNKEIITKPELGTIMKSNIISKLQEKFESFNFKKKNNKN